MPDGDELAQYAAQDLSKYAKKAPAAPMAAPAKPGLLGRLSDWYTRERDIPNDPYAVAKGVLPAGGTTPGSMRSGIGDTMKMGAAMTLPAAAAEAPATTLLGLGGSAALGYPGSKVGRYVGEQVGAPELGEDFGGLVGSIFGGVAGAKGTRPLGNKAASWLREPATPLQSQRGQPGTVKDILPANLQRWSIPPGLIPKGELGTPTNPGPFNKIRPTLTKAQVASAADPFTGTPKTPAPPPTPSRLDVSTLPEPIQRFPSENPGYMASVPRKLLLGLGGSGKLGAGEQLQQLGQKVLYEPRGVISGEKVKLPWEPAEMPLRGNATPFEAPPPSVEVKMGIRWAVSPDGQYRVEIPESVPDEGIADYAKPKLAEQAQIHASMMRKAR